MTGRQAQLADTSSPLALDRSIRYNLLFVGRKAGEGLAAIGRNQEAVRRWEKIAATAAELADGPLVTMVRFQKVYVNTRLAGLYAESGDARAQPLANWVALEITTPPALISTPWNEAVLYQDLGRVYLRLGRPPDAVVWLEKSLRVWKDLKIPAALESRRQSEQARVEADLAPSRVKLQ